MRKTAEKTARSNELWEESWIEEALTPREARLERAARGLQLGAALNGGLALLVLVVSIGAALFSAPQVFSLLHSVLAGGYAGADDAAVMLVVLLILANVSSLLVIMVGVLAQELWSFALGALLFVLNIALLLTLGYTPALLTLGVLAWVASMVLQDMGAFRTNPVMLKELRERMRGVRAFAVITVYLGLMSAFTVLLYVSASPFTRGGSVSVTGELGRTLFMGIVGIELLLIIFIAPAFTSGAVTGERERKTYDLLQMTLLPRPSFIIGKLESALGYIFLLLLAAIPLQSIAFLFGGVSEVELVIAFVILIVTAISLGTVGLYFSSQADRTVTASVRTYTFTFILMFAAPLVVQIIVGVTSNLFYSSGTFSGSPVIEATLAYISQLSLSLNPMTAAILTQQLLISQQQFGFYDHVLSSNGGTIPMISTWVLFTLIYLTLAAVMVTLAIRRMRRAEQV